MANYDSPPKANLWRPHPLIVGIQDIEEEVSLLVEDGSLGYLAHLQGWGGIVVQESLSKHTQHTKCIDH